MDTDVTPGEARETSEEEDLAALKRQVEGSRVEEARAFVRELEARWPDSRRVQYWARVLAPPKFLGRRPATGRSLERERDWLRAHAREYPGCWIAVDGDRLIAADTDLKAVVAAIKATVDTVDPLLHFQPGYLERAQPQSGPSVRGANPMTTVHGQLVGDKVLVPRSELEHLVTVAERSEPVRLQLEEDDLSSTGWMRLVDAGGSFDFWRDPAEGIYSAEDGEPV